MSVADDKETLSLMQTLSDNYPELVTSEKRLEIEKRDSKEYS